VTDVIVIGAGLAGLTAAALLAKRGLRVVVIDKSYNPGGTCGTFKRDDVIFDQGSSMLYGFGEQGFNAHAFAFNCLEEPIDMVKHELLYCVNFNGHRVRFWPDVDKFVGELAGIFPSQREQLRRFYRDMLVLYQHVIVDNPAYTTPDETPPKRALLSFLRHPGSYIRFLSYLNRSARSLLEQYFTDPEIFKFFDKLTSTYCYTTLAESPAVLAAVMFVDNHVGGSYYPAGSTVFLPGKLEKVIEEHGGEMVLEQEVVRILFQDGKPAGVALADGRELYATNLIYSGTVRNLYGKLIDAEHATQAKVAWAKGQVLSYPSVVLYASVDRDSIPEGTAPIEMLIGNPDELDESEVTVYIPSIDDHTLCDPNTHVVIAIGPTFERWDRSDADGYRAQKDKEQQRLIGVLERRFPGIGERIRYAELASPCTIERYTLKNGGSVAGPKQMLGQHMLRRQHTRTRWDTLYCCGEATVLGTGTPAVTTSGISAANAVLKKMGLAPFVHRQGMPNYVRLLQPPVTYDDLYRDDPAELRAIERKAAACQYCEHPTCSADLDIRGVMRRVTVGNLVGAKRLTTAFFAGSSPEGAQARLEECEARCIKRNAGKPPVAIAEVCHYLLNHH